MPQTPALRFLSLFVADLDAAREVYAKVFGLQPQDPGPDVLQAHPCSMRSPVVFDFGSVQLALYQQDGQRTHAGDVGLGVVMRESIHDVTARVELAGGMTFIGPSPIAKDDRQLAVCVLPDRHFFELIAPAESPSIGKIGPGDNEGM